ncbi:MAG: hypothetical protein HY843_06280 [Bdellovibrio sp.]|nr:hypothetical protein [Bdellovibrio sp.]
MDKAQKFELLKRSFGIKHKLKVHDTMKQPETHEEAAVTLIAKWELEDELKAIEEILAETRRENVALKRNTLEKERFQNKIKK